MSAAYHHTPIHIITVYVEPQNKKKSDRVVANLLDIVSQILDRLPNSKIIVSGDFNERRKEITEALLKKALNPVLNEGTITHERGNHLDQIFTNLGIMGFWCCSASDMTDHQIIKCQLSF